MMALLPELKLRVDETLEKKIKREKKEEGEEALPGFCWLWPLLVSLA